MEHAHDVHLTYFDVISLVSCDRCVPNKHIRGNGDVYQGICEAREVSGSHQMGRGCRCGVLAMSSGSEGAGAVENQRFA